MKKRTIPLYSIQIFIGIGIIMTYLKYGYDSNQILLGLLFFVVTAFNIYIELKN